MKLNSELAFFSTENALGIRSGSFLGVFSNYSAIAESVIFTPTHTSCQPCPCRYTYSEIMLKTPVFVLITEVKQNWAQSGLRLGTAWEHQVLALSNPQKVDKP